MPTTVRELPKGAMAQEPAGTIGSAISAILLAFFALLKVAGVDFADDLPMALNVFIGALLAVPALSGWLTRFFVYSPAGAQREVNRAAEEGVAPKMHPPPPKATDWNDPETWPSTPIGGLDPRN